MKNTAKQIFITILFFSFYMKIAPLFAKSYYMDQISVHAEIRTDGSLLVEESRQYRFNGEFHWADYVLPLQELGRVTNFSLWDDDSEFLANNSEKPGTYFLEQDNQQLYVKWFYYARDESRKFTLKYRVLNAVTVHEDAAEFYYKFVGENQPIDIGLIDVTLKLPYPADTSQVRAWAHGPLTGELKFEDEVIKLSVPALPRGYFWEIRTIFPPDWMPDAIRKTGQTVREQIFEQEANWMKEANKKRLAQLKAQDERLQRTKRSFHYGISIAVAAVLVWSLLFIRFGRGYPVPFNEKFSDEIPPDLSPAVTNHIHYLGQLNAGAMVATIFDLARRGFLKIEEVEATHRFFFWDKTKTHYVLKLVPENLRARKNELTKPEINLISFLFNTIAGQQNEIDFEKLRKKSSRVTKWFSRWKKLVKDEWGHQPFYERKSVAATVISGIIAFVCIILGILMVANWGEGGLVSLFTGTGLLALSMAILRYTPEVKILKTKLLALKRYLSLKKHHLNFDENTLSKIDRYFVYAVALGLGAKALKNLLKNVPDDQYVHYFPWYSCVIAHDSPVTFAEAASSMVTSVSTSMGSAAGVSGGASTGGGGGAGGASGGAG